MRRILSERTSLQEKITGTENECTTLLFKYRESTQIQCNDISLFDRSMFLGDKNMKLSIVDTRS